MGNCGICLVWTSGTQKTGKIGENGARWTTKRDCFGRIESRVRSHMGAMLGEEIGSKRRREKAVGRSHVGRGKSIRGDLMLNRLRMLY